MAEQALSIHTQTSIETAIALGWARGESERAERETWSGLAMFRKHEDFGGEVRSGPSRKAAGSIILPVIGRPGA